MEGTAGALIRSLFNAAGILVEARTEAILGFLDALMGEEVSGVEEMLSRGACGEPHRGRKEVHTVFTCCEG